MELPSSNSLRVQQRLPNRERLDGIDTAQAVSEPLALAKNEIVIAPVPAGHNRDCSCRRCCVNA